MRNQTSDLQILCSNALPLSHGDAMVSKIYYEVHMTCILHTARISDVNGIMCVPSWGLRIFFPKCPLARDKTKNIFLHFSTLLKTYHLYYFYLKTQSCLFWCCDVYFLSCRFICLFILPFFKISRNKRSDIFMNMAENLTCSKETYGETKRLVWATSWPCIVDQV